MRRSTARAGIWTITSDDNRPTIRARALVAADGALSRLARRLGYVSTPPDAVCSRVYMRAKTTNFDADGVVYYPKQLLPGYCAIFREARDELNFSYTSFLGARLKSTIFAPPTTPSSKTIPTSVARSVRRPLWMR